MNGGRTGMRETQLKANSGGEIKGTHFGWPRNFKKKARKKKKIYFEVRPSKKLPWPSASRRPSWTCILPVGRENLFFISQNLGVLASQKILSLFFFNGSSIKNLYLNFSLSHSRAGILKRLPYWILDFLFRSSQSREAPFFNFSLEKNPRIVKMSEFSVLSVTCIKLVPSSPQHLEPELGPRSVFFP